ncbi:hypothetical protein SO802_028875 [Lithocarpus litseifolius]|uniref:Uncharacterized protein n=1 Tax=Lithocarpus litseifolius TaxID=425828 RepID=A0AAW2BRI7_9ROSI
MGAMVDWWWPMVSGVECCKASASAIRLAAAQLLSLRSSVFCLSLFFEAIAIRYGDACGCKTAELLATNDSDLYHSKLVRFYTRIGFKAVHELTCSGFGDYAHMLVRGGVRTRMDANVEELLVKWCTSFKPRK